MDTSQQFGKSGRFNREMPTAGRTMELELHGNLPIGVKRFFGEE
jgi:hypothetical protein